MNFHVSMSDRSDAAKTDLRAAKRKLVSIERQIAATERRTPAKGETAKWRQILAGHEGARKRVQSDIVAATQKVAEVAAEYKMYLANKAERKAQYAKNRKTANARRDTVTKAKATAKAKSLIDTITNRINKACRNGNIAIIPQLDRELCAAQARL